MPWSIVQSESEKSWKAIGKRENQGGQCDFCSEFNGRSSLQFVWLTSMKTSELKHAFISSPSASDFLLMWVCKPHRYQGNFSETSFHLQSICYGLNQSKLQYLIPNTWRLGAISKVWQRSQCHFLRVPKNHIKPDIGKKNCFGNNMNNRFAYKSTRLNLRGFFIFT